MALLEDLTDKVFEFASETWEEIPKGRVVPTTDSVTFSNSGIYLDAAILYADIHGSTKMVDSIDDELAAEYYKSFLHCAAKIIKAEGGDVVAYDGDRVMAVFLNENRVDCAVKVALKISFVVDRVINPTFFAIYKQDHRALKHTVGIDAGRVLVAKTGVRDDNDLVWVGPAANYAAKLNSFEGLDSSYPTRITAEAYALIIDQGLLVNFSGKVWDGPYKNLGTRKHYRSSCYLPFN